MISLLADNPDLDKTAPGALQAFGDNLQEMYERGKEERRDDQAGA